MNKKCENPSCQNEGIKQYRSGWCCSAHCALSLAAKHSNQTKKEKYNGHYKCPKCNSEFKTRAELQQHKIDVHYGNNIFTCNACGKEFHSKRSLGVHKQSCEQYLVQQNNNQDIHYECNGCHRKFETRASLQAHISHCDLYVKNPPKRMHTSKYWSNEKQMYVCECGKGFRAHQSLNAHFSHCECHNKAMGKNECKRKTKRGDDCNFSKKWMGEEKFNEFHRLQGKRMSQQIKSGERIHNWKGRHHSEETKRKIRQSTVKYLINVKSSRPRYNKKSIAFFDKLSKERGWNLQHAENGGEFYTGIGYFVDAYDNQRNIVVEYDEKVHYVDVENNVLREKDLKRQKEIIEHLHCEYWRFNEKMGVLWKVES